MKINCSYSYYGENKQSNRPYLYCSIDNMICPLVRFCQVESRIINTDGHLNCNKRVEEVEKMPNGKYRVKFNDRGFLYVEIKDINQTRKIKNPFDSIPKFVDLVEIDNEYYIRGYEPTKEVTEEPQPKVKRNTKK